MGNETWDQRRRLYILWGMCWKHLIFLGRAECRLKGMERMLSVIPPVLFKLTTFNVAPESLTTRPPVIRNSFFKWHRVCHFDLLITKCIICAHTWNTEVYMDQGERVCHLCGIEFKYPSKLIRPLQSAKHIAYEANLHSETTYEVHDNVCLSL